MGGAAESQRDSEVQMGGAVRSAKRRRAAGKDPGSRGASHSAVSGKSAISGNDPGSRGARGQRQERGQERGRESRGKRREKRQEQGVEPERKTDRC